MILLFLLFLNLLSSKDYAQEAKPSIKPLIEFLQLYPSKLIQCTHNYGFNYKPFPLREKYGNHLWHPQGIFQDIFIIEAENSVVYIKAEPKENNMYSYYLYVNHIFIQECAHYYFMPRNLSFHQQETEYIAGTVAVVQHIWYPEYGHYMLDVLSNLALLEIFDIQYDYLLIPYDSQYMKEVLDIWGINQSKIIPLKPNKSIKADKIIFNTSPAIMIDKQISGFGAYHVDFLIQYIRQKLLNGINKFDLSMPTNSKIFLSKKDSIMGGRTIPNEKNIAKEFENIGYECYEFAKMSMYEKIYRASKATHLISAVGAGSLHAIFLKPNGYFCEIQTSYPESTFCYLTQNLNMNYRYINYTTEENLIYNNWLTPGKEIPINFIKEYINNHPEL